MQDPKEYRIEKLTDFATVPEDRISDCLKEFESFVENMRGIIELVQLATESTGDDLADAIKQMAFVWVDDGKEDVDITIHVEPKATGAE